MQKKSDPILITPVRTKPKTFVGYRQNEVYVVGCNGAIVWLYDRDMHQLARFTDFPFAYRAKFRPHTSSTLLVKSTAGYLGLYDLEKRKLLKKITVAEKSAQDEGFAFTLDGKYLCNIEKQTGSCETQLGIYDADDLTKLATWLSERKDLALCDIEFDETDGKCYVLGFVRKENGVCDYGFIGTLSDGKIQKIRKFENEESFERERSFKSWESYGFTEVCYTWGYAHHTDESEIYYRTLRDIYEKLN